MLRWNCHIGGIACMLFFSIYIKRSLYMYHGVDLMTKFLTIICGNLKIYITYIQVISSGMMKETGVPRKKPTYSKGPNCLGPNATWTDLVKERLSICLSKGCGFLWVLWFFPHPRLTTLIKVTKFWGNKTPILYSTTLLCNKQPE